MHRQLCKVPVNNWPADTFAAALPTVVAATRTYELAPGWMTETSAAVSALRSASRMSPRYPSLPERLRNERSSGSVEAATPTRVVLRRQVSTGKLWHSVIKPLRVLRASAWSESPGCMRKKKKQPQKQLTAGALAGR